MPVIIIQSEEGENKVQLESSVVNLGRGLDSDVQISDLRASRKHCQFVRTGSGYKVVDLGSGNGTKVNGSKIKEHSLRSGDLIQIGSTTILFAEDGQPSAAPPPSSPRASTPQQIERAIMSTQSVPLAQAQAYPRPKTSTMTPAPVPVPVRPPDPDQTEVMHGQFLPAPAAPAVAAQQVQTPPPADASRPAPITRRGTGRFGRGGRRGATSRTSMTARYGAKKRGFWTGTKVAVIMVLMILGGGGYFAYQHFTYDLEKLIKDVDDKLKQVAELSRKGKYEEAKTVLAEAEEMTLADKSLKQKRGEEIKAKADELQSNWGRATEAEAKLKKMEEQFKGTPSDQIPAYNKILSELRKLQAEYSDLNHIVKSCKKLIRQVEEAVDNAPMSTSDRLTSLLAEFEKLVNVERQYGDAVRKWSAFRKKLLPEDIETQNTITKNIGSINTRAIADVNNRLEKEARGKLKNAESKDKVIQFLEGEKPRFEGTEGLMELDKLIDKIRKEETPR